MQRQEAPECKMDETPPTLDTKPKSRCNDSDDAFAKLRNIQSYGSQQMFSRHDDAGESQSGSHVPNNRSARQNTGD